MKPSHLFLDAARTGRNDLWRYIVTVIMSSALVLAGSAVIAVIVLTAGGGLADLRLTPVQTLVMALAPYIFLVLGLWAGMRWLHRRGLMSLAVPAGRWRLELGLISAGLWFILAALGDWVMSLIYPGSYQFVFQPEQFWPFALAAGLLLPVQVAAEELWFRGYLTQGLGLVAGRTLAWAAPAVLFGLLHGCNPEVGAYGLLMTMPVYIGMGLLLGWVTLRTAGLEMAVGLHLANNLYATLLVTAPASALPAPALFRVSQYHPEAALAVNLAGAGIYVLIIILWSIGSYPGGTESTPGR